MPRSPFAEVPLAKVSLADRQRERTDTEAVGAGNHVQATDVPARADLVEPQAGPVVRAAQRRRDAAVDPAVEVHVLGERGGREHAIGVPVQGCGRRARIDAHHGRFAGLDGRSVAVRARRGGSAVEVARGQGRVPAEAIRQEAGVTLDEGRLVDRRDGHAAREVQVRRALVVQQAPQLIQVVHHAQVGRPAVGLQGLAAVTAFGVVPELVRQGGGLHERRADRESGRVGERAERHDGVAAREVADSGGGHWHAERRIGCDLALIVHIGDGCSGGIQARQRALRETQRVREQHVMEGAVAVLVEAALAGARGIAGIGAVRIDRRGIEHLVAQQAEAGLPTDGPRVGGELAYPRGISRAVACTRWPTRRSPRRPAPGRHPG